MIKIKVWTHDWEHKIKIITPKGNERLETDTCYNYFCYFRSCGSIAETARHFGKSDHYMREMATKYRWQQRLSEKTEYDNQIAQEELDNARNKFVDSIKKEAEEDNKALRRAEQDLLVQLGYIKNPKTKQYEPNLNVSKLKLLKMLTKIQRALSMNRRDMYRAYGLPDKINDKQEIKGEIENSGNVTLNSNVRVESEEEKLERYANYFKRIDNPTNSNTGE